MQIKVKDTRMHSLRSLNPKGWNTSTGGHDKIPVAEAKLVLVECKPEEALLFRHQHWNKGMVHLHKQGTLVKGMVEYLKPILISETEKIEVGDLFYWGGSTPQIQKAQVEFTPSEELIHKALALPEHFSPKHLQAIVDGKLKDGMKVLVQLDTLESLPPQYCISFNLQNHITLHKVEEKMYTREEVGNLTYNLLRGLDTPKYTSLRELKEYHDKWFEQNVK